MYSEDLNLLPLMLVENSVEARQDSGAGYGNPLQYSCLENSMDRGAWQAAVHGIAKSLT